MNLTIYVIAILLVHVPGLVIRLVPFYSQLNRQQLIKLFSYYALYLFGEILICYAIYPYLKLTLTEFKLILLIGNMSLFLLNVLFIPNKGQQLFIGWIVASIIQCMFTPPGIIVDRFFGTAEMPMQCLVFGISLVAVFLLTAYPLYKYCYTMVRAMLKSSKDYDWSHAWLLPFFIYASSFVYTLFSDWNTSALIVGRILCMIASVLAFKALTNRIRDYKKQADLQYNAYLLNIQVMSLNKNIANIQDSQNKFRILKHDMRHRIQMINTLLVNEKYDEIKNMLIELNYELDETVIKSYCVNPILNAAISAYAERAKEEGFDVNINMSLPDELPVDATQLAVAIANAFDNAIRAGKTGKENIIELLSGYNDSCVTLIIKNTFEGKVETDADGLPISSNNEYGEHGLGIRSILAFANANNADFTYSVEDNWFIVRLIIWNE